MVRDLAAALRRREGHAEVLHHAGLPHELGQAPGPELDLGHLLRELAVTALQGRRVEHVIPTHAGPSLVTSERGSSLQGMGDGSCQRPDRGVAPSAEGFAWKALPFGLAPASRRSVRSRTLRRASGRLVARRVPPAGGRWRPGAPHSGAVGPSARGLRGGRRRPCGAPGSRLPGWSWRPRGPVAILSNRWALLLPPNTPAFP